MPSSLTLLQRVSTLLQGNLKQILFKELHNDNRVNLYDVGEYWVAFEKSAYQLELLSHKSADTVMLHVSDSPFPVAMHCMHHTRVKAICRTHVMSRRGMEYLQLLGRPIDEGSYSRWHREHVDN